MSVLTVIKKIGDKVISVVEWPFKHAAMLETLLSDGLKDAPQVKTAIVGLVEQFGAVEPDFVAAITADGLNLGADLKGIADVKNLFVYFTQTFLPVVEKAYADLKKDVPSVPALPVAAAASAAQPGPGLHSVTPA